MPYLDCGDIRTWYEVHGEGEPLVLIHGALIDSRLWKYQVEPFSRHFKVITYDLRGHGKTGPTQAASYTVQLLAEDLENLRQHLGIESANLCGLSLGGMVAQAYAEKYSEKLASLILCDTAASTTLTLSDKFQTALFGWSLAPSVRLIGARRFTDYAVWMAKWTKGVNWFGTNQEVSDYVIDSMRNFDTREMAKIYRMIVGFRAVDLCTINSLVLIINGEFEAKSVLEHTEYFKRQLPQAESAIITNAGHTSNMENPHDFNRVMLEFLRKSGVVQPVVNLESP